MSFTIVKYKTWKMMWKKQSRFDDIIVFDEEFSSITKRLNNNSSKQSNPDNNVNEDVWLTYVDFAPTYKFDETDHCIKIPSYEAVVSKANEWLRKNTLTSQYWWTVNGCETLYAKVLIQFAENGVIQSKRVEQISKWQLLDELYLNQYDPNQSLANQCVQFVFDGRYIVQLLRVWLLRSNFESMIEPYFCSMIKYKDYWPKMIAVKEGREYNSNRKALEKMNEVTDRINLDIANQDIFTGPIINVITIPWYSGDCVSILANDPELGKTGQIINMIKVFFDVGRNVKQENLIGFADFIPQCIRGGGFIRYPEFESQSTVIQKASKWLAQNPELRFLNSNSVDIKLKSMTSIDSTEMAFLRNTGDFIRIFRICYTKPYELVDREEIEEQPSTSSSSWIAPPPPPPIYLNCKNITSLKNSTLELKQKLNEYLKRDEWNPQQTDISHRWKFLSAESLSIFTSNVSSTKKNADDIWENSFHAISISSSSKMNRSAHDGINVFYDGGYFAMENNEDEEQENISDSAENFDSIKNKRLIIARNNKIMCKII